MSAYLIIKKGGVTLGEWSRSTEMYEAFGGAPYEEEQEFDPKEQFNFARDYLKDEIAEYDKAISKYNKMLQGNLEYEDRWNCLGAIDDLGESIEMCKRALSNVDFLEDCWECDRWEDEPPVWTWVVS